MAVVASPCRRCLVRQPCWRRHHQLWAMVLCPWQRQPAGPVGARGGGSRSSTKPTPVSSEHWLADRSVCVRWVDGKLVSRMSSKLPGRGLHGAQAHMHICTHARAAPTSASPLSDVACSSGCDVLSRPDADRSRDPETGPRACRAILTPTVATTATMICTSRGA